LTLPAAPLSLDLDNLWSYLKTHGDPDWESVDSYLPLLVPRILEFLDERSLKITFFVVGRDVEREPDLIRMISEAGHEIANHSYLHHPWLQLLESADLESELMKAHHLILDCTGSAPRGFRGPGYSMSEEAMRVLADAGYAYDSTVFPNILNPLARRYFLRHSPLSKEELTRRRNLFGSTADVRRPIVPFRWSTSDGSILEVPITSMPLVRMPFHFSYLIYLASYSPKLARGYFRTALWLCHKTTTIPCLLLHPLDFLGITETEGLDFFPGMKMRRSEKLRNLSWMVDELGERYRLTTFDEYIGDLGY